MGEEVTGFVSTKSGASEVVIIIRGKISPECQEELKAIIKKWAEHCGLTLDGVTVKLKKIKKKKKKKLKK